ncbi:MAG: LLM class flavin-dependent oxidoreductase [Acidimicrobiia bacterium]|nr:LLM class flavin-dependent oxidoreductase [Acidimicrobiia bacterium]
MTAMDKARFTGVQPAEPPGRVIAALGPKMLALSAELADGAHPYFVPPDHTVLAREAIGKGKLLAVEQIVVPETDPTTARDIARRHMGIYLGLANYANNLVRMGYSEADITGAADKVVDAIVAWGTLDDVLARVKAHHDAGANHACVQGLTADAALPRAGWSELAGALL